MLLKIASLDPIPEDEIVKSIIQEGLDQASIKYKFRMNTKGERRPDTRCKGMKHVVERLR